MSEASAARDQQAAGIDPAGCLDEVDRWLTRLAELLAPWMKNAEADPTRDDGAASQSDDRPSWSGLAAAVAHARALLNGKLRWEIETRCSAPWLVMVAGGTNVGKSQLFNAIVRRESALPDARGAQTKHPLAFVHRDDADAVRRALGEAWSPRAYSGPEALNAPDPADARDGATGAPIFLLEHDDDALAGLCLLDAPDIDSNLESNRHKALRLIRAVDCVLYVAVTEKYNDRLCVDFLRACADEGRRILPVFNLATRDNAEAQEHFRDVVLPELFGEAAPPSVEAIAPVYERSERHAALSERVGGLRSLLLDAAAGRLDTKRQLVRRQGELVARALAAAHLAGQRFGDWRAAEYDSLDESRSNARRDLEAAYDGLPFYEMDEVFRRVYAKLEVPYLDLVLQRATELTLKAVAMLGASRKKLPKSTTLRRHRHDAEDAASEAIVGDARHEIDQRLAAHAEPVVAELVAVDRPADGWISADATLFPRDADDKERLAAILDEIEENLADLIDRKPGVRRAIIGARAVLMLGGAGVVVVSAGMSTISVVLGSSAAAVVRNVIEKVGRGTIDRYRARYFGERVHWAVGELAALQQAALERLSPPVDTDAAAQLGSLHEQWRVTIDALTAEGSSKTSPSAPTA